MNDDWRLQIDFVAANAADALHDKLDARELEHDLSEAFHDRVIVSRDKTTIFLYAGDREQAEKARTLVERLMAEDEEEVEINFRRWHPIALEWRPADEPLPQDAEARAAEHQAKIAQERWQTAEQGFPPYEVHIDFPSHEEAERFADQLRLEFHFGAADEDAAKALAEQIRSEAPAGSKVSVEGTFEEIAAETPNPFAFLGGLGN
jgi:hypothetical protein